MLTNLIPLLSHIACTCSGFPGLWYKNADHNDAANTSFLAVTENFTALPSVCKLHF